MPYPNLPGSDRVRVVGVIDPDAYTATDYSTGWIHMGLWDHLMAIIFAGTLGSSATVDAKFEQATDSGGTGAKDVTGKAITQLTQAGTDSDKQAIINLFSSDLDVSNDFDYARLTVTVGTATSDMGAVVLGLDPRYGVGADATTVDEIV